MALDSSAAIYLLKSELLLKLEAPPTPPKPQSDYLPPPLFYPLRYELTSTTITHLLKALDKALSEEQKITLGQTIKPTLPPPPEFIPLIDLYLIEIDKRMEDLHHLILHLADEGKLISFSEVISKLEKIEAIKTFLTLLFLAQKGKVALWQEDDLGDIYITPKEVQSIAENREKLVSKTR